eukprot:GFKZ01004385.1.p3 GENE.GFKZ01004385.1~~GFKZ01004385.1.p3  ORF type:complete len:212 (+),score=61.84 GFKZ01004385.1:1138-1773(+)
MGQDGRGGQTGGERVERGVEKLFAKLYVKDAGFLIEPIGAIGGEAGGVFVGVEIMEMGLKGCEGGLVWGESDKTGGEGALGMEGGAERGAGGDGIEGVEDEGVGVDVDDVGVRCEVEEVKNGVGWDGEEVWKVGTGEGKGDRREGQDERCMGKGRGVLTQGKEEGAGGKNVGIVAKNGGDERGGYGVGGMEEVNKKKEVEAGAWAELVGHG